MSSAIIATDATFQSDVLDSETLTLVDFWAPWCAPCRMILPTLEELASEYSGRLRLVKVNVDENPRTATQYAIRAIPNLIFFKDGKPADQVVGGVPKAELVRRIEALLT
ncbi:MAG: thioredoxin [Calditrichaeota bacterium]|nr:thioredoxin [Calditrichota bacterium]